MSEVLGRRNERKITNAYTKQDYQVLNVNEKGFPDLIVLWDGKIRFLVELKVPKHRVHDFQKEFHRKLEAMGFKVKIEIAE